MRKSKTALKKTPFGSAFILGASFFFAGLLLSQTAGLLGTIGTAMLLISAGGLLSIVILTLIAVIVYDLD